MTLSELLGSSWTRLAGVAIATVAIYVWIIVATRMLGLRTFAKMSSFDFAATVATGSILASTATGAVPLVVGICAIAVLFAAQAAAAWLRRADAVHDGMDNTPVILMKGTKVVEENLRRTGVHRYDIAGKLRESGVTDLNRVAFVILETTGEISVLQGDPPMAIDEFIMLGVEE